ncbi:hypothetical protein O0880_14585 [Janthinobacterium sp. SUN118]|uniref:hypothetical protein n=1 Tax=Janthinobacterium sp. SUN118 TaxID=3004100 RepID=UPI0025AFE37E|nr:hypothetical protein [Janthinobacterium sp. SUN118]MDN2710649.1 hypothetical protein [Janthinobacterium sp. SUN118]
MSNILFENSTVDGGQGRIAGVGDPCSEIVKAIYGDDVSPPIQNVIIEVLTSSGALVRLVIPNSNTGTASVYLDDKEI